MSQQDVVSARFAGLALSHRLEDPESIAASRRSQNMQAIASEPLVAESRSVAEQIQ